MPRVFISDKLEAGGIELLKKPASTSTIAPA